MFIIFFVNKNLINRALVNYLTKKLHVFNSFTHVFLLCIFFFDKCNKQQSVECTAFYCVTKTVTNSLVILQTFLIDVITDKVEL